MDRATAAAQLKAEWKTHPRWKGIQRPYTAEEVINLRGSVLFQYQLAMMGAQKLFKLLESNNFVRALGAMTGLQAVQQVQAGLKAIYVSGWQVAADANDSLQTYPDLSLYPSLSAPHLVNRIQNALRRADQIQHLDNGQQVDWFVPLICDAEAGFGGVLNCFELVKAMIEAGAAAVHLEDQLSTRKKCGHMGGKVLIATQHFISKLTSARLAADVLGVPTLIIARTDAEAAGLLECDIDEKDHSFLTGERTQDGLFRMKGGLPLCVARALSYAPYADLLWFETSKPDLGQAKEFAQAVHEKFPGKWLAYNCSPSFNWASHLDNKQLHQFQDQLGELGYKFQFVTLAGFHSLNAGMFELANQYRVEGMAAYSRLQEREFELEDIASYKGVKHQAFVGTNYYDQVLLTLSGGKSATTAMSGSTEEEQFL